MEPEKKMLLDSAIDLVSFFNIVQDDIGEELDKLASDLDRSVDKNNNVEILHTGSGFEELSLPHIENFMRWNTDADHMIIKTDVQVVEDIDFQTSISIRDDTNGNEAGTKPVGVKSVGLRGSIPEKEKEVIEAGKADIMERYGSFQGCVGEANDNKISANASVRNSNLEHSYNNLLYIYDGSHAGYGFVSTKKLSCPIDAQSIKEHCQRNSDFIENCRTTIPLSRSNLMAMDEGQVTGPSYSLCTSGGSFNISRDFVYGLKCTFWPSQALEWVERERLHAWPSKELISASVSQGCHIVPVASHDGNFGEFEWRFSFSVAELKLVQTMNEKQKLAYSILKAIIKHEMKRREIDVFASYHLKTTLLWFLEKNDWKTLENESLGESALELLDFLIYFYSEGVLPNYFIRNNNMIDHRSPEEINSVCEVFGEIKTDFTMALCRYIEANQALPVFFDAPLSHLLEENCQKFHLVCKYNFLVMALAYILMSLRKGQASRNGSAFFGDMVCRLVQKASKETNVQESASEDNGPNHVLTVASVLGMIEQSLEKDKMKVTENSAVILAVFNLFLTFHPTPLDKARLPADSLEFHKHLTNPAYMECLTWAGCLHEKYCDVIYDFVVKKWINGPSFQTEDEQARKLMKLLMVMLGKPTKQAGAITGSLVRREVENKRFILLRMLSEYLLHVHLESSYIAFQACGYLMNKPPISEISLFINWGSYQLSKLRAVELILSKDELLAQLSEKEFERLVQLQHDLTQQTASSAIE